jgi:hypothetical protein
MKRIKLIIPLLFCLFACEKQPVETTFDLTEAEDLIILDQAEVTIEDLQKAAPGPLIAFLDQDERVFYLNFEFAEGVRSQFQAKDLGEVWLIEKGGELSEYLLASTADLDPATLVTEEDEAGFKNLECTSYKKEKCLKSKTLGAYRLQEDASLCKTEQDATCVFTYKKTKIELNDLDDCTLPTKYISIRLPHCSR